jgi:hypothetical protein
VDHERDDPRHRAEVPQFNAVNFNPPPVSTLMLLDPPDDFLFVLRSHALTHLEAVQRLGQVVVKLFALHTPLEMLGAVADRSSNSCLDVSWAS